MHPEENNPFPANSNIIQMPIPVEEPMPAIYIAGPMTGYPDLNHSLFNETAEAFEDGGWRVFNPVNLDIDTYGDVKTTEKAMAEDRRGFLRKALGHDLEWITREADAIAMLPGWENSKGARAEHATAVALGLQIIYLHS